MATCNIDGTTVNSIFTSHNELTDDNVVAYLAVLKHNRSRIDLYLKIYDYLVDHQDMIAASMRDQPQPNISHIIKKTFLCKSFKLPGFGPECAALCAECYPELTNIFYRNV